MGQTQDAGAAGHFRQRMPVWPHPGHVARKAGQNSASRDAWKSESKQGIPTAPPPRLVHSAGTISAIIFPWRKLPIELWANLRRSR